MHPFKSFTLEWWQGGIFKLAMLAGGVAMAMSWPQVFSKLATPAWLISACLGSYIAWVWLKQIRR